MAEGPRRGRVRANVLPFPHGPSLPKLAARRLVPSRSALLPSGRALLIGFALLGAGVAAYVGARETSLFAVRVIEIAGAPPRVADHVREALRPLEGQSLVALNEGDIGARLRELPDVARFTYDRDFPHTLRLVVTPAHSIAVLRRGPSAWIVSSEGRVVRSAGLFSAPRLPRMWVPRVTDVAVGRVLTDADAARMVSVLATARAAGFGIRIRTVRASEHELTFVLAEGLELRFGDASALRDKLAVARQILRYAAGSRYADVSVPERPVVGENSQVSG
jgi:cell division septal protein FtsQ